MTKKKKKRRYKEKECLECGKLFKKRGVTCSRKCSVAQRKKTNLKKPLTCELCGKTFYNTVGRGKFCTNDHYTNCRVCGKSFVIPRGRERDENPTCGYSCGAVYSHRKEESKEKRRQNSLKKWGVEHPFQAPEVKEKIEKALEGTAGRFGTEASKKAIKKALGVENASQLEEVKKKKAATYKKNYTDKGIYPNRGPVSKTNLRWQKLLEDATGLEWELEKYFDNVGSIDLYAENKGARVAVEISPTATHSTHRNLIACSYRDCPKDEKCTEHTVERLYHQHKARDLKKFHNISLTTIFDWTDEEKIVSFIRSRLKLDENKVYGKQTEVREISQRDANRFLKEFHMLGPSRLQKHCYGLYYDDLLVQVQTFAPLKQEGVYEARRLATRSNWAVIGGVSKITKHFLKTVQPKQVVAFSDLNLSWPDYDLKHNDFERIEIQPPQKCWSKGSEMILAKTAAWQSADRLLGIANDSKSSIYPEDWTNDQVFLAEGWLPVWDCGMIKDVWTY